MDNEELEMMDSRDRIQYELEKVRFDLWDFLDDLAHADERRTA